ncbi:hypothetical protein QBC43DRAFT_294481 [Cladorrhinum sp. PSN259]|nr:hypothetical protein QBC43DRAFT_294481 [Cladorrhinum sp. PSN259]
MGEENQITQPRLAITDWWGEALKRHNDSLKKTTASKRFISLQKSQKVQNHPVSAHSLLEAATAAANQFRAARTGQLPQLYQRIVDLLDRHTASIDVFIQHQPFIAAPVWGTIRIILHIHVDKQEASEIALEGIAEIIEKLDRWDKAAAVFYEVPAIKDRAIGLYCHILGFLSSAKKHFEAGPWKRFGQSAKCRKKKKFQQSLEGLRAAARSLDEEVYTESPVFRETKRMLQEHRLEKLRTWLQSSVSQSTAEDVKPTPGSTQWIYSNRIYQEWLEGRSDKMFWIHGSPGKGKSVLAHTLAYQLRESYSDSTVIFYCFSKRMGPSKLAGHILWQYLQRNCQHRDAMKLILDKLEEMRNGSNAGPSEGSFADIWAIVLDAFETFVARSDQRVFIVVDALDQYEFKPASAKRFLTDLSSLPCRWPNIRVAVATRPRAEFSAFAEGSLRISLTAELLAPDIELFASAKFDELGILPEFKEVTMCKVRQTSQGSFLYVSIFLEYMSPPLEKKAFLERLHNCPPAINEIYERMLEEPLSTLESKADPQGFAERRETMLKLICAAKDAEQTLTTFDLARTLELGGYDAKEWVMRYCQPLVSVEGHRVRLIHSSVAEFLTAESRRPPPGGSIVGTRPVWFTLGDAHTKLALECLNTLLAQKYSSAGRIGQLLHHNFEQSVKKRDGSLHFENLDESGISLDYAAQNWDFHLLASKEPPALLLSLTNQFLHSFNFVFWAEWSVNRRSGSISRASAVRAALMNWKPSKGADIVIISDYFVAPYQTLSSYYRDDSSSDKVLQYLPLMRLGRYYVNIGMADAATPLRKQVCQGLTKVLGDKHPLTLQARSDLALSLTLDGEYEAARTELEGLVRIMKVILGQDSAELYRTMVSLGEAELYTNRYEKSAETQRQAAVGFARLAGVDSKPYLTAMLWVAYPYVQLGNSKLKEAEEIFRDVWNKRKNGYGEQDLFAASTEFSLGGIYRRLGLKGDDQAKERSIEMLEHAFAVWKRAGYGLDVMWGLDPAIGLLLAYRDFGRIEKAKELLEAIENEAGLKKPQSGKSKMFGRYCQVTHVKALMMWEDGECDQAVNLLQGLVIKTDRKRYHRALLWIIVDLAQMLRLRGKEGDEQLAESYFDHILVDVTAVIFQDGKSDEISNDGDTGDPEPDPPRLLKLAQTALTLTREAKFEEVAKLFRDEKIRWFRERDFWLWFGGPPADTAWMKPPREKYIPPVIQTEESLRPTSVTRVGNFISGLWTPSSTGNAPRERTLVTEDAAAGGVWNSLGNLTTNLNLYSFTQMLAGRKAEQKGSPQPAYDPTT